MAVRKKREVGAGDDLVDGYRRAVVLEGAVGRQRLHSDGLAGVVWVRDHHATAIATNSRHGAANQAHILLALNHDDAAGRIGHLIDRREVDGDCLAGHQTTRTVVDGEDDAVGIAIGYLVTVVHVREIGDIAERDGGTDRQLIAAQFEHAFGRSPARRYLDDDLVGAVVRVRQSQIHLTHRATSYATTRGCNEKDTATFCCTQPTWGTNAGRTHRGGVVLRRNGEGASEVFNARAGVVCHLQGEGICITRFGSTRVGIGQPSDPVLHGEHVTRECRRAQGAFANGGHHSQCIGASACDADQVTYGGVDGVFAHGNR